MSSAVRVSCGLYKMLLLTHPGDFRLRFGSEMVTTFSDLICGEWEHNGLPGVVRVWRFALAEVFSRCSTSTAKLNCGCDVAVAALLVRLVHRDISCNVACVQRQIVNWFSGSKTISAEKSR